MSTLVVDHLIRTVPSSIEGSERATNHPRAFGTFHEGVHHGFHQLLTVLSLMPLSA